MSDWLRYSPKSGHGNGTITITADTLSELEDRVATIVASNSEYGVSDSVLITQYKTPPIPLTFEIISGGTILWQSIYDDFPKTILYSKNDSDWVEITPTTAGTPIDVSTGDIVKFKGNNSKYAKEDEYYNRFQTDNGALFNVKGNIMSLINSDGFISVKKINKYSFHKLFYNCIGLVSAENLILPATTLAEGCYNQMFDSCTSLTTAPELPATTLAPYCYNYMFRGCTSLTTAPELPATTLAKGCYSFMFQGCNGLTTAPELPATTLEYGCYYDMFSYCHNLTSAPSILPATTLASSCYSGMFSNCTSLTSAPELPATTISDKCYYEMFLNCISLTKAPSILPATTLASNCYTYMFQGCTSLTTAPALPATTLAFGCYDMMFWDCTSLTTAPELPATTLAEGCYYNMFVSCTSLSYIKCLATDISAYGCTYGWVDGVASTGTFVKNPNMSRWTTGISGIPSGWTVIDAT